MEVTHVTARTVLIRSSGFLSTVSSHSLQPYRGCTLGRSMCGQACYVQHNRWITQGRPWGSFLEVRDNAAAVYAHDYQREKNWARNHRDGFSIFLSSSTEPFQPHERKYGITRSVLEMMLEKPPDALVLQTRSPDVALHLPLLQQLAQRTRLKIHLTVESDRDGLPGLPRPATTVDDRLAAAAQLHEAGLQVVITVSPILPIHDPEAFFRRIATCAGAVVLDHFIEGDGSSEGARTRRTAVPQAMARVHPPSVDLAYREELALVARRHLPGRVGLSIDGFAGRYS